MSTQPDPDTQALSLAAERLLERARALGAEGADATCTASQSLSVSVRLGKLEGVEREESRSAGLRVLIGQRQAGASTTDLTPAALDALAERVVVMARAATEDPWCGLPGSAVAGPFADLDLFDPTPPDIAVLEARALEAEQAALDVAGVTNSSGSGADWGQRAIVYAATNGFHGAYKGSSWGLGLSVLAEKDGLKERDYDGENQRRQQALDAALIGRTAGERAVARLAPRKLDSRTAPVILENRVSASLLRFLVGGINGGAIARGTSFLREKLGQPVFARGITVRDDPFVPGGWGSHPFDGEGQAPQVRDIIEDGVLTTWLLNTSAARQLGLATTGHAAFGMGGPPGIGPSNLTLLPGPDDLAGLMAVAGTGLLVRETSSPSFNPNTGDWSVGVSGHWFEGGQVAFPVSEMTVAGNMLEIFARLVPGSDLRARSAIDAPSILIDGLTVAGT
jgi:PmbA protein